MSKKVVVGILEKGDDVLLVKRKKNDGIIWAFPGGEVEDGEEPSSAVIREIKEESDVDCKPVKLLGLRIHPISKRDMEYWECEYEEGEAKVVSEKEIEEVAWKPRSEVVEMFDEQLFESVREHFLAKEIAKESRENKPFDKIR
jgi:8-oxo-dGTP diphosphatase